MNQTRQIKFLGKVNTNIIQKRSDSGGSASNSSINHYDSQRVHFKLNKKQRLGRSFDQAANKKFDANSLSNDILIPETQSIGAVYSKEKNKK